MNDKKITATDVVVIIVCAIIVGVGVSTAFLSIVNSMSTYRIQEPITYPLVEDCYIEAIESGDYENAFYDLYDKAVDRESKSNPTYKVLANYCFMMDPSNDIDWKYQCALEIPEDYNGQLRTAVLTKRGEIIEQVESSILNSYKTKVPYVGMPEEAIRYTVMGQPDEMKAGSSGGTWYYWNTKDGRVPIHYCSVCCRDGFVSTVNKDYEDKYWYSNGMPNPRGWDDPFISKNSNTTSGKNSSGSSSGKTTSGSSGSNVYSDNKKDYKDAYDYADSVYEDYYEYDDYEDEDDAWDAAYDDWYD